MLVVEMEMMVVVVVEMMVVVKMNMTPYEYPFKDDYDYMAHRRLGAIIFSGNWHTSHLSFFSTYTTLDSIFSTQKR